MKTLGKLKLNHLGDDVLDDRQLNLLKGGSDGKCNCSCIGCSCKSWDGTGTIPPGANWSDAGSGSVSGNLSGTVEAGIGI